MGGFLWLFMTPIVQIITYAFVFRYVFGMRGPEEFGETSFVIFMVIGYLPWFAFADAVSKAPGLLLEKSSLVIDLHDEDHVGPRHVLHPYPAFGARANTTRANRESIRLHQQTFRCRTPPTVAAANEQQILPRSLHSFGSG
jgi:hypothetical protein